MLNNLSYKILLLIIVMSCSNKQESIEMRKNSNVDDLKKYINVSADVKECTFEILKKGVSNPRSNIGLNDYELFAVLSYQEDDFNNIVKKVKSCNKLKNVYLDVNKVPEWFPTDLISGFEKEGEYYHLINSYDPKLFLLNNENKLFKKGFCYIGNNNLILYLYTE